MKKQSTHRLQEGRDREQQIHSQIVVALLLNNQLFLDRPLSRKEVMRINTHMIGNPSDVNLFV
jgi:hypothetical protein